MKIIANKITQEKDEFGVIFDVNNPAEPFPENAQRIVYDGIKNHWQICEDAADVAKIMTDYPEIKAQADSQKVISKTPVDAIAADDAVINP